MIYSTKVLVVVVVFSQMAAWNKKNCTARGEAESLEEAKTGPDETKSTPAKSDKICYGPYFKEFCPEESPCCFFDGKNHTCTKAREEGEECTHDALGYNTDFCFCKKGLFCVDKRCTSQEPKDTNQKLYDMYKKK